MVKDKRPYTFHLSPFTLHPSPFTLHPSPFTFNLQERFLQSSQHSCTFKTFILKASDKTHELPQTISPCFRLKVILSLTK